MSDASSGRRIRHWLALFAVVAALQATTLLIGKDWAIAMQTVGDAEGYAGLSRSLTLSPLRPPGYPAFLAVLNGLGLTFLGVLFVQGTLLAAVAAVLSALMTRAAGVGPRVAWVVALASATSGTALWISKRLYADALFAFLVFMSCAALMAALTRKGSQVAALSAGVASAIALLVKPAFVVWPVVVLIAALAGAVSGGSPRRSFLAMTLAPWTVTLLALCTAMYLQYGVFSASGIGTLAVTRYWAAKTSAIAAFGSAGDAFVKRQQEAIEPGTIESLALGPAAWGAVREKGMRVIAANPSAALRALADSAWKNLPRPWFPQELRGRDALRELWPIGKALVLALYLLAAAGVVVGLRAQESRAATMLATGVFLVFCAMTSISFWEGARLMFPVEWVLFFLAGITLARMAAWARGDGHGREAREDALAEQAPGNSRT